MISAGLSSCSSIVPIAIEIYSQSNLDVLLGAEYTCCLGMLRNEKPISSIKSITDQREEPKDNMRGTQRNHATGSYAESRPPERCKSKQMPSVARLQQRRLITKRLIKA